MNKSHYEVVFGLGAIACGGWMVRASFRSNLPRSLRVWWTKPDSPHRPTVERALAAICGLGFALVGLTMVIHGIGRLLRSPS